jgi:hypothetical protein
LEIKVEDVCTCFFAPTWVCVFLESKRYPP